MKIIYSLLLLLAPGIIWAQSGSSPSTSARARWYESTFQTYELGKKNFTKDVAADLAVSGLEIWFGGRAIFAAIGQETRVGSHSLKLVQAAAGIFLMADGVARAVIVTDWDREPTIFPILTYGLTEAGVIEAPAAYRALGSEDAEKCCSFSKWENSPQWLTAISEVVGGSVVAMLVIARGAEGLAPVPLWLRVGAALAFLDGFARFSALDRGEAELLPLASFVGKKISAQFHYKNRGELTERDLQGVEIVIP